MEQGRGFFDTPGVGETLLVSFAPCSAGVKTVAYGSHVQCIAELITEQIVDHVSAKRVCVL
jgi:hypothetical protein